MANVWVSMGEIELMSMNSLPAARPCATPSSPNSTFATSAVSGTMAMTVSAACATAAELGTTVAWARRSSGTECLPLTTRVWPPLSRLRAMWAPMMPKPMKPMVAMMLFSQEASWLRQATSVDQFGCGGAQVAPVSAGFQPRHADQGGVCATAGRVAQIARQARHVARRGGRCTASREAQHCIAAGDACVGTRCLQSDAARRVEGVNRESHAMT